MITFGGAEIYIGVPPASVSFGAEVGLEDFDGVTWELVDGLYNIGEINSEQTVNEFEVIGSDWMRKVKSTRNSGSMLNQFVPDGLDPGQLRMASAVGNCRAYPIRVVYKGACDGGDIFYPSGETVLFYATVSEGVISGGGKGELLLKSWQLNITTNVIRYYPTVFFGEALSFDGMAQDAGGTVPVTAVEQPVGLLVNQSGNSSGLAQETSGMRPSISARINRLVSGDVSGYLPSSQVTISQVTKLGYKAFEATQATAGAFNFVRADAGRISQATSMVLNVLLYAGSVSGSAVRIGIGTPSNGTGSGDDLWGGSGSVTADVLSGPGDISGTANGLVAVSLLDKDSPTAIRITREYNPLPAGNSFVYIYTSPNVGGGVGDSVVIQRMDLRLSTDLNYPEYQDATSPVAYDTNGFPKFLRFDGVDDFLESIIPAGDYTIAIGTLEGTNFNEITHPGGQLSIGPGGIISTHNRVIGVVIREGELTPLQKSDVIEHFRAVTGKGELV